MVGNREMSRLVGWGTCPCREGRREVAVACQGWVAGEPSREMVASLAEGEGGQGAALRETCREGINKELVVNQNVCHRRT